MDLLVSVIIITYNSANFILETLESIKKQTYKNIELIITDDCSQDNTVQIIKDWLEKYRNNFVNICIVESKKNTGVSANCNRGLKEAHGEYVKFLAGDDLLLPNCISLNINFTKSNPDISFLFSNCGMFSSVDLQNKARDSFAELQKFNKKYFELNARCQFKQLLKETFIFAPSSFIKRKTLIEIGGFDERFTYIEDYPLWWKATNLGYKLYLLDVETVLYRVDNANSLSFSGNDKFVNKKFFKDIYGIYKTLRRPYINLFYKIDKDIEFLILKKVANGQNTKSYYKKLRVLKFFSPLFYMNFLKNWIAALRTK